MSLCVPIWVCGEGHGLQQKTEICRPVSKAIMKLGVTWPTQCSLFLPSSNARVYTVLQICLSSFSQSDHCVDSKWLSRWKKESSGKPTTEAKSLSQIVLSLGPQQLVHTDLTSPTSLLVWASILMYVESDECPPIS